MDIRYIRNLNALTLEECEVLLGKKIFVAGCGGLGGYVIDMLLRIGVGEIRCADGDSFEESNLNRQLLSSENNILCNKSLSAAEHAKEVNSSVVFCAFDEYITDENAARLISGCDIVIDALDTVSSRRILKKHCDLLNIPYIYGAVQGWIAQAAVSMPNDGMIDTLYPHDDSSIRDKSILSFTPALCAAVQVALCVKVLCGQNIDVTKLYYFNLDTFEFESLPILTR